MSQITPLIPSQPVPELSVRTVGGSTWNMSEQSPENFTLVVFFRGLHCPICANYLCDLQRKLSDFTKQGVNVIAISSDSKERAEKTAEDWGLDELTLGYGLDLITARRWGLFVSTGRGPTSSGIEETRLFNEPGLYLIRPDGTLYFGSVQTMPFSRPILAEILNGVKFVLEKNYPARGQVVDHVNPEGSASDWPNANYDPQ